MHTQPFTGFRHVFTILSILVLLLSSTRFAAAAAPSNDDIADAIEISGVPYSDQADTSEATSAESDPTECHNNGSVWYTFTPGSDMWIDANTFGSDYDTTLGVYSGTPGSLILIGCNDDSSSTESQVIFDASGGTTYYFLLGFCCGNGSSGGGNLVFSVDETTPLLDISVTIGNTGSVNSRTGLATVSGTVSCNTAAHVEFGGDLRQNVGRFNTIRGGFNTSVECTPGAPASWSATVVPESGKFGGGSATVNVSVFACDAQSCDDAQASGSIQLRSKK